MLPFSNKLIKAQIIFNVITLSKLKEPNVMIIAPIAEMIVPMMATSVADFSVMFFMVC